MATEIVQILDFLLGNEFWYTSVENPYFFPNDLEFSIEVMNIYISIDILTQILLIMGSIDYSSTCKLNVHVIAHTKEKHNKLTRFFGKTMEVAEVSKIWLRMSHPLFSPIQNLKST